MFFVFHAKCTCNCLGCSLGSSTNLVFASLPHFYGGKLNKVWCLRAPLFSIQNTSTQDVQQNINILSSRLFTSFNQPPNSALIHLPPTNSTWPPSLLNSPHPAFVHSDIRRISAVTLNITQMLPTCRQFKSMGFDLFDSSMHSSPRICQPPPANSLVYLFSMWINTPVCLAWKLVFFLSCN